MRHLYVLTVLVLAGCSTTTERTCTNRGGQFAIELLVGRLRGIDVVSPDAIYHPDGTVTRRTPTIRGTHPTTITIDEAP